MQECERKVIVLPGGVEMALRRIPAGEFTMGSRGSGDSDEEPEHRVVISRDFWLGETPVTQAQFATWSESDDYAGWFRENAGRFDEDQRDRPHQNSFQGDGDLPAENLSWYEARAFCRWLVQKADHLPDRFRTGDLPTEAQWEYACRGGPRNLRSEYWNGDGEAALDAVGWFAGNADSATHPVASRGEANPCGLFDLHGNVWQWCRDRFAEDIYGRRIDGAIDPRVRKADVSAAGVDVGKLERGAKCFAEIVDQPDEISQANLGFIASFLPAAEQNAPGSAGWQQVVDAVRLALADEVWPPESVGVAEAVSKVYAREARGFANTEDPPRVVRGGSWGSTAWWCRAAFRFGWRPGYRVRYQGFRLGLFPGSEVFPVNSSSRAQPAPAGGSDGTERTPEGEGGAPADQSEEKFSSSAGTREAGENFCESSAMETSEADKDSRVAGKLASNGTALRALFSSDGQSWNDGNGPADGTDPVGKIVIGSLETSQAVSEGIVAEIGRCRETLTHLHLWGLTGLEKLTGLPPGLQCLDVRNCPDLSSIGEVPNQNLRTLVLENCGGVEVSPAADSRFPELRDLSVKDSLRISPAAVRALVAAGCSPVLERFDASGNDALTRIDDWAETLQDVRLDGCTALANLAGFPMQLRRLQLGGTALRRLPDFPSSGTLGYIDLSGMRSLDRLPEMPAYPRTLFLHGSGVLMPPASEHGAAASENVAVRTRAYFDDYALAGPGEVRRCKLLVLGNGCAGKTCFSLRLVGDDPRRTCDDYEPEEDRIGSTHGIQFHDCSIRAGLVDRGGLPDIHLHVWDFGGQEIYHNTHRIFVSTGTAFTIVWNPQQKVSTGPVPDDPDAEYVRPLSYWLDYIDLACPGQPKVAIVVAGCAELSDDIEVRLREEAGEQRYASLKEQKRVFSIDSLEGQGHGTEYHDWLSDTVGDIVSSQGTAVPSYWQIAQEMVDAWNGERESGAVGPQQMTPDEFGDALTERIAERVADGHFAELKTAIDKQGFGIDAARSRRALRFLTHSGWIYWNPALFAERAIIRQEWALDGIYTLLQRSDENADRSPVYDALIAECGKFTLEDLSQWGWSKTVSDETDRRLLLSYMERNHMVFALHEGNYRTSRTYLSLAHLPACPVNEWRTLLAAYGAGLAEPAGLDSSSKTIEHRQLHRGHWEAILAQFGAKFGTSGRYARDGFFFENEEGQAGMLTVEYLSNGIGGNIEVDVRGEHAAQTRDGIVTAITEAIDGAVLARNTVMDRVADTAGTAEAAIKVFVSYTWDPWEWKADPNYEEPVDAICEALRNEPVKVYRDKTELTGRDSITEFMGKITETDWVIVVHSDKYWRSAYCMWEMWALFQSYKDRDVNFHTNLILVEHESSKLRSSAKALKQCIEEWQQFDDFPSRMLDLYPSVESPEDLRDQVLPMLRKDLPKLLARDNMYKLWGRDSEEEIIEWIKVLIGLNPPAPSDDD